MVVGMYEGRGDGGCYQGTTASRRGVRSGGCCGWERAECRLGLGRIRDVNRMAAEVATLAHAVCVTHSVEQELVGQRWCYVPFETNDVGALCWKSVEDHPSESVNRRVSYTRCFRREARRVPLRLCERCGKVPRTG